MPTISRILSLRLAGVDVAVPSTISVPLSGDGFWECQFEIGWPEGIKSARARGFDGVQAIYGAMRMIAVYLYASPHHKAGNLSWGRPGDGYGFTMPKVGYGDLIGEDRIAQVPDR